MRRQQQKGLLLSPPGGAAASPAGQKHRRNGSFSQGGKRLFWYRFTTQLLTPMGAGLEQLIKKHSTSPRGCGAHCKCSLLGKNS